MSTEASTSNTNNQQDEPSRVREVVGETAESIAASARDCARDCTEHYVTEPAKDLFSLAKDYAKSHPDVAAAWAFGLGLVVGWKIRP